MRDAPALLRDEGLVDRIPGAGTFVVVQGLNRSRGPTELLRRAATGCCWPPATPIDTVLTDTALSGATA